MLFQSRVLHVAKDLGFADEYEDAFCVSDERGAAAIADGVSSAVFSGQWSRIVTEALIHQTPDLHDAAAFRQWLKDIRATWLSQIDLPRLPPNLQAKLRQVGGAFCTLLWLDLQSLQEPADGRFRLKAYALGDTSLFHVRNATLLRSFPMTYSAEFDADPMSLCSVDWNRDQNLEFKSLEVDCEIGDLVVLATDAVAKWILATIEAGGAVDWNSYLSVDESAWIAEIEALRSELRMRRDDSTLILLSIGQPAVVPAVREPGLDVAVADDPVGEQAVAIGDRMESAPFTVEEVAESRNMELPHQEIAVPDPKSFAE